MYTKGIALLGVVIFIVTAVVCWNYAIKGHWPFAKQERFVDYIECSLAQYFTENSNEFSNDENDDKYWLAFQSSNEQEVYSALMKEADNAEAQNNLNDASTIRGKIDEMKTQRVILRKKALEWLEGTRKIRERGLDMVTEPNSCTVKVTPKKVFDIIGNSCTVTTLVGGKENVYSYPDVLKATKPDNVFTVDGVESCYLTFPADIDKRVALVMVLNVLDAIGEKLNAEILDKITQLTNEALSLIKTTNVLTTTTIPKNREELQNTINDYLTTRDQVYLMSTKLRFAQSTNEVLEDENKQLNIDKDDIVEIWEHCNKQGRRYVLPMGLTVFKDDLKKLGGVSSIYFNNNKGIYVILYDNNYRPYTLRKSVDCLTNVNIGGNNTVNLNDSVKAVEVLKEAKLPSNGMILSSANQNIALGVQGYSKQDFALIVGDKSSSATNQKWTYNDSTKQLVSGSSGKCMDANYGGTANGTKVIQFQCHTGPNMKWDFKPSGHIVNRNANKCLQTTANSRGVWDVYLQSCDPDSMYQKWEVVDAIN